MTIDEQMEILIGPGEYVKLSELLHAYRTLQTLKLETVEECLKGNYLRWGLVFSEGRVIPVRKLVVSAESWIDFTGDYRRMLPTDLFLPLESLKVLIKENV